jgi:hypothetical protein
LKNINNLKYVLQTYTQGSGQKINLQKYILFFGKHCPDPIKQQVMESLEVFNVASHSNYLDMPIYVGQSKTLAFNFISESMWRRVQGWNNRPTSRARKETMLKSVVHAIPVYIMSCFQLPENICDRMRVIILNN